MRATLKSKYKKMMTGLRSNVECPVCISVPTDGHMLTCPRGHLVCNTCRVKMRAEGQENCPVCREPMGNNKSLLAMAVIENMEHECTNTGCKEMLSYDEVKSTRRNCASIGPFSALASNVVHCFLLLHLTIMPKLAIVSIWRQTPELGLLWMLMMWMTLPIHNGTHKYIT